MKKKVMASSPTANGLKRLLAERVYTEAEFIRFNDDGTVSQYHKEKQTWVDDFPPAPYWRQNNGKWQACKGV